MNKESNASQPNKKNPPKTLKGEGKQRQVNNEKAKSNTKKRTRNKRQK